MKSSFSFSEIVWTVAEIAVFEGLFGLDVVFGLDLPEFSVTEGASLKDLFLRIVFKSSKGLNIPGSLERFLVSTGLHLFVS